MVGRSIARRYAWHLRARRDCVCQRGLSRAELDRAQEHFGVVFPPVWCEVLRIVHPVAARYPTLNRDGVPYSTEFPDWRIRNESATRDLIDRPIEDVVLDVGQNAFWWKAWGAAPETLEERVARARHQLASAPRLTPLWSGTYVASTNGSPVFRIQQTEVNITWLRFVDMIADRPQQETQPYQVGDISFWSLLSGYSQYGPDSPFADLATRGF